MLRKRPMNRSRLLMCAAALVAAACQDRQSPPAAPSFLIQDAAHNGGNPHFYWLPPMTRQPSFTGTFDGTLAPVVEISELGGVTGCASHVVATFTTTTGPGSETVRVDLVNQLYIVNWRTKAFNLNTACTYRIRFLVAGLELGIADVDVVDNGAQLRRVDTDDFVPLLDDGTLPIKARVELGAVTFALTGDATACRPGRDCGEAVVTPVPGQDVTVLTTAQTAGLFIPAGALAEQVIVLIESRTDRPCIPLGNMALPQFPDCYRFEVNPTASIERLAPRQVTEGEIHNSYRFQTDVIVGMCVEVGNLTPGQQARLDLFRFDPVAGTVNTLPDAPARFLPCDPNFGTTPPVGASGVWQRGWRVVMNSLHALFGTRTAYASTAVIHLGLGGSTCCTSYFTWGIPGVMSPNGPTTFSASPGSTVLPSVVVKDSGGTPIAGAMVTFAVATGNGTIVGTNPMTTGANGDAAPIATIRGSNTGLNFPLGIALDGAGNIYVANFGASNILIFAAGASGNVTPIATIAVASPCTTYGVALDGAGNLYVTNFSCNNVLIFAAGSGNATLIAGGNTGLTAPAGIALDGAGNIYVANPGNLSITVYAAGASGDATPIATSRGSNTGLTGAPYGIALDGAG